MRNNDEVVYSELAPNYHVIDFIGEHYNAEIPLEVFIQKKYPYAELVPLPPYRRGFYFLLRKELN